MSWASVLDQATACDFLRAHLASQHIAPAYLFIGPPGVGKRLAALEFAKALNCDRAGTIPAGEEVSAVAGLPTERGGEAACDACGTCQRITRGVHPDVHQLSPQGALSLVRVDDVRQVLSRVGLRPYMGRWQVAIIDGADRLNEESGNLLLKTLEEPPRQTRFVLLTSQLADCLPTIVSRCERVRFQRLPPATLQRLLAAQQVDPDTAVPVSRLAGGSLSQALELSEQWTSYQEMMAQLGRTGRDAWLDWPVPTDRDVVGRWLAASIAWLRDVSLASAGSERSVRHGAAAIGQQAAVLAPEACAEAAVRLVHLSESLEQLVSPRMVGTLLREEWIKLWGDS